MKGRIARAWIAYTEVSGGRIPAWAERWLKGETAACRKRESTLTRELRSVAPEPRVVPAGLGRRIESRLNARPAPPAAGSLGWMVAGSIAAVLVAGAWAWHTRLNAPVPCGSTHQAEVTPVNSVSEPRGELVGSETPPPAIIGWSSRIDQPLEKERERLVADFATAVQLVVDQFIPQEYLPEVEAAIEDWRG